MEAVFYKFETQKIIMTREELIEKLMNVAENYKKGYLHGTGAITDIGVLLDEYTETVVKNCSMPDVSGSLCPRCKNGTIMNNDMWCSNNKCGNYPINYR